jgi:hypothetical protein
MSQSAQTPTPSPPPNPPCASDTERTYKKKKKKNLYAVGSSYVGKCDDIKEHVYNIGPMRSLDVFAKTTQEIGEYLVRTIKNGAEFRNAFDPEDLDFETIVQPPEPEDINNPTCQVLGIRLQDLL